MGSENSERTNGSFNQNICLSIDLDSKESHFDLISEMVFETLVGQLLSIGAWVLFPRLHYYTRSLDTPLHAYTPTKCNRSTRGSPFQNSHRRTGNCWQDHRSFGGSATRQKTPRSTMMMGIRSIHTILSHAIKLNDRKSSAWRSQPK